MFSFVTGKSRKTARNGYTFPPNLYKSIIYIIHIYILVNCIIPLSVLLMIYIFVNCVYIYNLYKLENKFIVIVIIPNLQTLLHHSYIITNHQTLLDNSDILNQPSNAITSSIYIIIIQIYQTIKHYYIIHIYHNYSDISNHQTL